MIIFYKEVNFFKMFSMISFCMALLIFSIIKLPHYYPLPTVVASFKGCSEYNRDFIKPITIHECSFVDSTGYRHIIKGYSGDTFNKMSSEPTNKIFKINDSRYEDLLGSITFFATMAIYLSMISCLFMIPFAINNKAVNDFEKENFMHIDA